MIERNIFQTWYTKELDPSVQRVIDEMKDLNPTYQYFLYDDAEMDAFVDTYFPGVVADCYHRLTIMAAKVDLWRCLVLYQYGGVYVDIDSTIIRSLDLVIQDRDEAIVSPSVHSPPGIYIHWILIFRKGHPLLKRTIDLIVDNIQTNRYPNDVMKMTGPNIYSEAVAEAIRLSNDPVPPYSSLCHYKTDITFAFAYNDEPTSVRILGFQMYLVFKYNTSYCLYRNKKHWYQEQAERPLLSGPAPKIDISDKTT